MRENFGRKLREFNSVLAGEASEKNELLFSKGVNLNDLGVCQYSE